MSNDPDNLVLSLLRDMRAEMATKTDLAELRSEFHSGLSDIASDLVVTRKELSEQIVGLRRAMIDYHTTVVGHASLITDLEARLRRVEQHLNLSSSGH